MTAGWNRLALAGVALAAWGSDGKSGTPPDEAERYERARQAMVDRQIVARGIRDARVIAALRHVPRHLFVPRAERDAAYNDRPLGIGYEQTISQPYIVALMSEALALQGMETVLEIGTGSGYQAAVLAGLARSVHSIEIVPELAQRARETLAAAGYPNVQVHTGDGWAGWPDAAPYDAIVATCAPKEVPPALVAQLRLGGRLVLPLGPEDDQQLVRLVRTESGVTREVLAPVRFVPMTGEAQRQEDSE
jgi:protein-L-isoaspartate(D-aspartate) O-methyltransferase